MTCSLIREVISAELDGEDPGFDRQLVDGHLRRCAGCRAFAARALDLVVATRGVRVEEVPDLSSRIVADAVASRDARLVTWPVRVGLVFVAAAQLVLAVPGLVFGSDDGAPVHVAHEMGSWDLALAIAFLFVAWRPLRAVGLLPFVAVLAAGLCLTAVVDLANGHAVALLETSHLLELVGTALLWLLARPVSRRDLARRERVQLV
jgi:predicted anti-sigma-YlaC factor YlaD